MTCDEARLLIGAEPQASTAELEEHVRACAACARFREEMRTLDANIRRALEQPPPEVVHVRPKVWRQWALAASVLLALSAVLGVWLLRPSDSLAQEVVAHVAGEPDSWLAKEHISAQEIQKVLNHSGVAVDITSDRITYAQSCFFRGHYVPHLVVQTAHGPATVMILKHEHVSSRRSFREEGMTGVIVPDGTGSIAVLARDGGDLEELAGEMQHDVHWMPSAD
jgi:hypothetical protein